MESDPAVRNVVGLVQKFPDLRSKASGCAHSVSISSGCLAAKAVHPAWAVPGGVREALTVEQIDWIRQNLPEAFETAETAVNLLKDNLDNFKDEIRTYGDFPSLFIGLVTPEGGLSTTTGCSALWTPRAGFSNRACTLTGTGRLSPRPLNPGAT